MEDITIQCHCGKAFLWTVKDQEFYQQKGYTRPKNCKKCRDAKKMKQGFKKQELTDDKPWGTCESCQSETFLVAEVGLCGPCCFGEAETINGNW